MAKHLDHHVYFRPLQKLPFCYLCGETLPTKKDPVRNRDHVPPSGYFGAYDLSPPLILPTHTKCNGDRSSGDEIMGQLISTLHGRYPRPDQLRLKLERIETPSSPTRVRMLDKNLPLISSIWRCVRGFHTALYRSYLPSSSKGFVSPPFPAGDADGTPEPVPPHVYEMSAMLKVNRLEGHVDAITSRNGKCRYICTWLEYPDFKSWGCLWALDIYGWADLGDLHRFPRRGCIGVYLIDQPPADACRAKSIAVPENDRFPLDPFARY